MKKSLSTLTLIALLSVFAIGDITYGQSLIVPRVSPQASVSQRIGITDITIEYSRPQVKGRVIWGELVPYNDGKPNPWRVGANENTTISFSDDVRVEGKALKAGTYGLHMIPSSNEWTVIFSSNSTSWGSYFYDPSEDVARITVNPEETEWTEAMRFTFDDLKPESVVVSLRWEKLRIPFRVEVPFHDIVLASFKEALRSSSAFSWQNWNQAARYCLDNDLDYELGLEWIEQSVSGGFWSEKNFTNLRTKSELLAKVGKTSESEAVLADALELARMPELHQYGRSLIRQDKPEDALKIFKMNQQRHPNDKFTIYVGLARGYQAVGNKKEAIKNWKIAIEGAPEDQKAAYLAILDQLKSEG